VHWVSQRAVKTTVPHVVGGWGGEAGPPNPGGKGIVWHFGGVVKRGMRE